MNVVVRDDLFSPDLIRTARESWPAADWPGWVRYDPKTQCKRASDLSTTIPAACGLLLTQMAALPVRDWFGGELISDLGLHGAGLHEMPRGEGLLHHFDADTHARLGVARVLSGMLYVHEYWPSTWGGALAFNGAMIEPRPGRLVIFDSRDAQHAVGAVTCPDGICRRSLAMFWYAANPGPGTRVRAHFANR